LIHIRVYHWLLQLKSSRYVNVYIRGYGRWCSDGVCFSSFVFLFLFFLFFLRRLVSNHSYVVKRVQFATYWLRIKHISNVHIHDKCSLTHVSVLVTTSKCKCRLGSDIGKYSRRDHFTQHEKASELVSFNMIDDLTQSQQARSYWGETKFTKSQGNVWFTVHKTATLCKTICWNVEWIRFFTRQVQQQGNSKVFIVGQTLNSCQQVEYIMHILVSSNFKRGNLSDMCWLLGRGDLLSAPQCPTVGF